MAKRLTKKQKVEILEGYRSGKSLSFLAQAFDCTPNTISRSVKSLITTEEYSSLKAKQNNKSLFQKASLSSINSDQNQITEENSEEPSQTSGVSEENSSLTENFNDPNLEGISSGQLALDDAEDFSEDEDSLKEDSPQTNVASESSGEVFHELIPLASEVQWEEQKEVACKTLSPDILPAVVYMLVDKKVELEIKPLKEFSQWSFLPEKEQNRLAITLFSNQRNAKRSCSRNQRILKVPNPLVFMLSSPFLIGKGITRLILDDSLIAIDSL